MRELILQAVKQSTTEWEDRPSWWNSKNNDDFDLLASILDYGYGGFDEMLESNVPFCVMFKSDGNGEANALCRTVAQLRINHLTRDLHSIDDNQE